MLEHGHPEYRHIKPHILKQIDRYVKHHERPGDFLIALLSGRLNAAFGLGTEDECATVFAILEYCSTELPTESRGSEERVRAWMGKLNPFLTKS